MNRTMRLLVTLLCAIALAIGGWSIADAHNSTYTGHNFNGVSQITAYNQDWYGCDWVWTYQQGDEYGCGHWHQYAHLNQFAQYQHACWVWLQGTDLMNHANGIAKNWWYNDGACFRNEYYY